MFVVGTCGCFGTDETLACFIAGCAFNWDGWYHAEIEARHDTFNCTLETALNFGTFIYLGVVMPWDQLHLPNTTGITVARLLGLGVVILIFRRIPAILFCYRFMPRVCHDWKEAVFMGYFAPIGELAHFLAFFFLPFPSIFERANEADAKSLGRHRGYCLCRIRSGTAARRGS